MITLGGKYYLTYSANSLPVRHIHWGYAVSDSPLGPFVKAEENPAYVRNKKRRVGHRTSQLHTVAGRYPAVGGLSFPYGPAGAQRKQKGEYRPGRLHGRRKALYQRSGDGHAACTFRGSGSRGYHQSFHRNGEWGEKRLFLLTAFLHIQKHADMDMKLEAENGGTVKVTLEADEELPVSRTAAEPGGMKDIYSVSLCVDDRICSEEYIVGEEAVSPLLLSFEPVQAQKIDFVFTMREGADSLKLSKSQYCSLQSHRIDWENEKEETYEKKGNIRDRSLSAGNGSA